MKKITRREAIRLTRMVFNELAESGDKVKPSWLHEYKHDCTLCEYVQQLYTYSGVQRYNIGRHSINPNVLLCEKYCPLQWPKNNKGELICTEKGGLFRTWNNEYNRDTRKKLAKQIANLPVKRKSRCKDSLELGFKDIK